MRVFAPVVAFIAATVVSGYVPSVRSVRRSTLLMSASKSSSDAPPLCRAPARKVCLMVEPTPFTHVSGYANRFKYMLQYLAKAGDKVEILTVDSKTDPKDLPNESFGFPIEHTMGFTFPWYNQISLTIDLPELKGGKILERFRPDLIHVTSPGLMVYAAIFYARVMRIPLLMSYHTHLPIYAKNYWPMIPKVEEFAWWLMRYVHSRADLTLVTSPQIRDELVAGGIPRVDVWRKGIDTVRFDPKFKDEEMRKKMSDGNPDDFLMVYVGRLGAEKRLKDIRAVLERMPNARLCLVGKGPQKEELEEYFKGTNTVFTGQLGGDDLSRAFASADAFVMPSDSETLGFVVLESMASGVPVVGVDAGGIPDIIDDGETSFLVPIGDTDAFVDRLTKLRDPVFRKKMGKAARAEAERWGWEAATSYLRNVQYERAMINFHSRAFGGFGRPGSKSLWRLLRVRVGRLLQKLRVPGFRRNRGADADLL
uniref:Glycosyltransferase subfamily 4-like N-terminal domain-containing protein n=4 Tax=Ditylum brightwellii TaxID=49249 RepID=A0A6V2AAT1_9STRA|mmetsp:Transcript_26927/g.39691  ORF Transcript_26927/g.39691 Transcript_26927/m.39691 type:complete len:480 (+) Transcript_26927:203-1642(+)